MATSGLAGQGLGSSPTTRLEELFSTTTLRESSPRLEEIQQTQNTNNAPTGSSQIPTAPDSLFTRPPPIKDLLQTKTSTDQDAVSIRCQVIHSDVWNPLPNLMREAHIQFLEDFLGLDQDGDQLPPGFVMLDASRPWLLYWCLIGLHCLGSDLAEYRERLIDTLRPIQNRSGGFGGGNGQKSHVAVSYASVLSLCTVGGKEAFDLIDRVSMWRWLSGLKQLDGGFRVCDGGEEDVRGAYCTLTLISLLGLPTELAPEDVKRLAHDSEEMVAGRKMPGYGHDPKNVPKNLLDGVAEYIGRCQTYEGGIAGGPGGMEAHGGYAFCSLAALCLLGEPQKMLSKYLDLPKLISWLSARQYAPEGGFSGRTNKLVDGCYSTWVGGCWALVEAALNGPQEVEEDEGDGVGRRSVPAGQGTDLVGSLWSRDGLVKYILGCCQDSRGGLRDKPGKSPDQYHSAYILLGLSSAQNYQYYVRESSGSTSGTVNGDPDATDDSTSPPTPRAAFQWRTSHYVPKATTATSATGASGGFEREQILSTYDLDDREKVDFLDLPEDDGVGEELGDSGEWWYGNRVRRAHPIFNVPYQRVGEWSKWVWGDEPSVDDNESSSSDS
ncbi:terpenoid cyclases/protein prenyltransferase alpha-alpha toroid [Peziza echinospora]|nr:terpenoid cyclases/protein prenyltransferase alpha-alpha toroid [Peziza echinospora]